MPKNIRLGTLCAVLTLLAAREARADVASLEAFGLSAHLGSSYASAPRGLDSEGVYVFNPGMGLEWDFRNRVTRNGLSPVLKAAWLQDCDDRALFAALVGLRFWHAFASGFVLGGSLSVGVVNGEDWGTDERVWTFMPLPIVEVGQIFASDYVVRLGIVYVPPNGAMTATDNDGVLFFILSFGRSILA